MNSPDAPPPVGLQSRFKNFLEIVSEKIIRIHDSPQRISLGLALGVFLGILPGLGPIASLLLASLLRLNQAAALTGSLLTNTWMSVATFVFALKIGSALTGSDFQQIAAAAKNLMEHFRWQDLWDTAVMSILKPLLVGYAFVGLGAAVLAGSLAMAVLSRRKVETKK